MNVIGIAGKAGSGKDTIARMISCAINGEHGIGKEVIIASFAMPLKQYCSYIFDVPLERFYVNKEDVIPEYGMSPRDIMQKFGTDFIRQHFGDDFWINKMEKILSEYQTQGYHTVIIPDVRFENEASFVRKLGHVIHVERTNMEEIALSNHVSEKGISVNPGDIIIRNDGTLGDLQMKVDEMIVKRFFK